MNEEKVQAVVDLLGLDTAQRMLSSHADPAVRWAWKGYAERRRLKAALPQRTSYKAAGADTPDRARAQRALDRLYAVYGDAAVADMLDASIAQAEQQRAAELKAGKRRRPNAQTVVTSKATRSAVVDDILARAGR